MWQTIHQITPTLFLSSGTAVANKQAVLDKKIKLIVNATLDLPNRSWNNQVDVVCFCCHLMLVTSTLDTGDLVY